MKDITRIILIVIVMAFFKTTFSQESQEILADEDIFSLSLEELLNVRIVSASNVEESLSRAPATIIIVSASDIQERGYLEMYDVLNDLPGFDLSRAFGDDNYYLYARGYRKETSDQMLLMIDGMAMNHLYSNNMNLFAMYPLANVQQIEVVYGPASAVYGPNAFAGVINIITKKEGYSTVSMRLGQGNTYAVDVNYNQKINDVNISFTGRFFDTDGHDFSNRTSALDSRLYNDTLLWGPFADTDFMGYQSPINTHFTMGSVNYKGLTLGFINFLYETGYGTEWPGDKVLNARNWGFDEQTYFARYESQINIPNPDRHLHSKTLLRYRQSGHPSNSLFLERYNGDVDASYWQTTNHSISFFQDFAYTHSKMLSANFGVKYDRRTLQGAYNEIYGPFILSDAMVSYPFPEQPQRDITMHNHFLMQDKGVYAQVKASPTERLDLFLGLRYDHNSIFSDVFNPRAGVVFEPIPGLITKFFYGQAYLEPTARILYGGWQGSLSNVDLRPERIQTFEGTVAYAKGSFSNSLNVFYNQGHDVIAGAQNIGERRMMGVEYGGKVYVNKPFGFMHRLNGDLYVSYINSEEDIDDEEGWKPTGNMAPFKVRAILTAFFSRNFSLSLQNRWIDEIETVATNPIDKIDSHFVSDGFITYRNAFVDGLSIGLKVYNIFNADYYHPGYRDASAGEDFVFLSNGSLDETISGSQGWYNSRLPQPMRTLLVNLSLTF